MVIIIIWMPGRGKLWSPKGSFRGPSRLISTAVQPKAEKYLIIQFHPAGCHPIKKLPVKVQSKAEKPQLIYIHPAGFLMIRGREQQYQRKVFPAPAEAVAWLAAATVAAGVHPVPHLLRDLPAARPENNNCF